MIGHKKDIELLEQEWRTPGLRMPVIHGMIHTGKTTLLETFSGEHGIPMLKLESTTDPKNTLAALKKNLDIRSETNTFSEFFADIFKIYTCEHTGIIVDEFQFILQEEPDFFQKLKENIKKYPDSNIFLLFSSSFKKTVEQHFASYKSLFLNNRTLYREIRPLSVFDSKKFFPDISFPDFCHIYAMTDGMPYYFTKMQSSFITENLQHFFDPSVFQLAGTFLLADILAGENSKNIRKYRKLLEFIAQMPARKSEIISVFKDYDISQSSVISMLSKLLSSGIIRPVTPLGENFNREKYLIDNLFLRFWYRFISPTLYDIRKGDTQIVSNWIAKNFKFYMKYVFTQICQQWLEHEKENLPFIPTHYGPWWKTDKAVRFTESIDLVASNDDGDRIFCACLWNDSNDKNPFRPDTLALLRLQDTASHIPASGCYYCLFSKFPFSSQCEDAASHLPNCRLITLDSMYEEETVPSFVPAP